MKDSHHRSRTRGSALAAAAVLSLLPVSGIATDTAATDDRIVAVGDVHGSYDGLTTILRTAGIIDEDGHWSGGGATFVQTGDLLDRGTRLTEVLDLLMRLEQEAPRSGGRVIVLLGNHEAMNLLGITRDVNRDAYAEFADEHSGERQAAALAAWRKLWRDRSAELGEEAQFTDEATEQWLAMHPPGFVEYSEALGPNGRYGEWLRNRPTAVILGDTLFIHGGYGPAVAGVSVDDINREVADELATFDRTRAWMVSEGLAVPWSSALELVREAQREVDWIAGRPPGTVPIERRSRADRLELTWGDWYLTLPDGPLWFRGLARWDETEHQAEIAALLDGLGVRRQVVGHNPLRSGRITPRFGGRVLLIDTGMLASVYGGRPSALEIRGDELTAVYADETVSLGGEPAVAPEPEAAAAS